MSLEEATRWLKTFEGYLAWNESVIERKSRKYVRELLESLLDMSLILRLAKDKSITETTTVRGSTGVLSILQGYFVHDYHEHQDDPPQWATRDADNHLEEAQRKEHEVDPTPNPTTKTTQYQSWTTMETTNPVQYAWIFQAYLRQVTAMAQQIETSISHWKKHKSAEGGDKTMSKLGKL